MPASRLVALLSALLLTAGLTGCPDSAEKPDDGSFEDAGETDSEPNHADVRTDTGDDAGDSETSLPIETHFSRPEPGQDDSSLEDLVIDLLDDLPEDATVRAAFYTFSRTGAAEAFVDAHERGVALKLIVDNDSRHDDGSDWQAVSILRDGLGDNFTICRDEDDSGGCHGTGIQHNKFIAFSQLGDGSENVVLQSSSNLTNPQLHYFNNTVIIRDDEALHDAYVDYWNDLSRDEKDLDYYHTREGDHDIKVHFFPRETGDTILEILDDVDCRDDTRLHLGMAYFTDPRIDIAGRLAELADDGCDVHALVRRGGWRVGVLVLGALEDSDVKLSAFDNEDDVSIHSKSLLLDGNWRNDDQKLVWTGSHNYTGPALTENDEVLMRIRDDDVYEAFLDDWNHVESFAERLNH